jgi:hypothetical protein
MKQLADQGSVQQRPESLPRSCGDESFGARVIYHHIPDTFSSELEPICRIFLENAGQRGWFKKENPHQAHVRLGVYINGKNIDQIPIREDTHPGERIHFSFHLHLPKRSGKYQLSLKLLGEHFNFENHHGLLLLEKPIVFQKPNWIKSKLFKS